MQVVTVAFILALVLAFLIQNWLDQRQIKHVQSHRDKVPDDFADRISLAEHQKAADYTLAKTRFGVIEQIVATFLLLAWTLGGGLEILDQSWRSIELSAIQTGMLVMLSFILISTLLEAPLSAYRTFNIEQRFGFNKMTLSLYISDTLKQSLLTIVIGAPLLWVVLWLMQHMGTMWWIYVWA
ncbi:MAG: M48 family peptidase, partial [Gammaproteobacteria bacterium]|nr:M48 family peptidase [Gammaproteobacteria bacterium]